MKKLLYGTFILLLCVTGFASCEPDCKKCYTELMGVKTPEKEYCGEQLKQIEKTQSMICK